MAWSPQMRKWMKDAPAHGMHLRLFTSKGMGGKGQTPKPPTPPALDESLLTEVALDPILKTQDLDNILITEGFINTEGTDPITTENNADLII